MIKKFFKLSLLVIILPLLMTACPSNRNIQKPKIQRVGELPEDYDSQRRNHDEQKFEAEATKWGQAERKSYEERYRGEDDSFIYQGNIK
jgi:hypothetical protein